MNYPVEDTGDKRTIRADVQWILPLEFVEVRATGKKFHRQSLRATTTRQGAR
jgi:hypothetical protein